MNIKNELIVGIIGSILIIFLTIFYSNQYQKQRAQFTNQTSQTSSVILTGSEVARHNTAGDCWIIIQGSVYNVTQYLQIHPGGSDRITPFCGQDATTAYSTKGGRGSHSSQADSDLSKLKLGQLNETVNITSMSSQIQNNTNSINSSGRRRNDDD
jgi:cytochrome b involved in lipid metabolism